VPSKVVLNRDEEKLALCDHAASECSGAAGPTTLIGTSTVARSKGAGSVTKDHGGGGGARSSGNQGEARRAHIASVLAEPKMAEMV
jgi:hypothetical protein